MFIPNFIWGIGFDQSSQVKIFGHGAEIKAQGTAEPQSDSLCFSVFEPSNATEKRGEN
jgi:hypothetical protein